MVRGVPVNEAGFAEVERQERQEVAWRARRFRGDRTRLPLAGRTALIVDDGVATGSTARAACRIARAQRAARVVLVAPVCASEVADALGDVIDEAVCLMTPEQFGAVGQFYADFRPTSDGEVVELLRRAARHAVSAAADPSPPGDPVEKVDADGVGGVGGVGEEVEVVAGGAGGAQLGGELSVPAGARGLVVFVHGSGSSRHSPRNRYVAGVLQAAGLATLLFDLITRREELDRATVFDVRLLAGRLTEVTSWVRARPQCRGLRVGYFGASTGAAAALWAATTDPAVAAVVSRGGRPDLAAPCLEQVRAPTLLVVGGRDAVVLEVNRRAQARMRCEVRLAVVAGATHLFEEPGTLEQAAGLARDWLVDHLGDHLGDHLAGHVVAAPPPAV